jgi:NAD(P)-dependent dehydrogenase (short-subunit alcohol dehydrogenase family)
MTGAGIRIPEARRDLTGRVVLVTGASGNLGRATAQALRSAGAALALVGRDLGSLAEAYAGPGASTDAPTEGSQAAPPAVHFFTADLSDLEATAAMVDEVLRSCGRLDAVVHTAGVFRGGTPLHETSIETLEALLRGNLYSSFSIAHAALRPMLERGRGSLAFVAAQAGQRGRAGLSAYCAAKSGVIRIVESLAEELRGTGVRANCVLPEAIAPAAGGAGTPPAAIADVLAYLASDASSAISGAAIPV